MKGFKNRKMLSAGRGNRKVDLGRKHIPADNVLYFLDQKRIQQK
jgi:hypothetical protein